MVVQTSRFGSIQVQEEETIIFPEGILGFQDFRKFILVDDPTDEIFAWLQSAEEPGIAFPILEPELFVENYKVNLARTDFEALQMSNMDRARLYCIVTIPDDPTQMTANMKAPVVINVSHRLGRQCVLQDNSLAIREPIFSKLQQRVVAHPKTPMRKPIRNPAEEKAGGQAEGQGKAQGQGQAEGTFESPASKPAGPMPPPSPMNDPETLA
ncbi:MAG: flagellar assembly protein FliW [Bdellovibrio sp.]|nr:MAG: flagellar assembly protein FliW [Bdellovibrio sp.]